MRVQCVLSPALSLLFVYAAGLGRQQGSVLDPVAVAPLQSDACGRCLIPFFPRSLNAAAHIRHFSALSPPNEIFLKA